MNYMKNIGGLMMILLGCSLGSCSDDDSAVTPISLEKVTTIADLSTPISKAALGDFIAIHGTGLDRHQIDSVLINDVAVDMQEIYTENDILYMKIPVKLPVNETNKIYIFNKEGVHDIPFEAVSPNLKLTRMFNEYTAPGDTIMIYGDFFTLYEINGDNAEVDFNGKKSKVITSGNNFLTAQVPKDVEKNIKVKVRSKKYTGVEAVCPGYYYDQQFIILDFDNKKPDDMSLVMTDEKDKNRLSDNYLHIDNNSPYSGWWYIAAVGGVPYTDDMLDHSEKYVIKCEFMATTQFIPDRIGFYPYLFWDAEPAPWVASDFKIQTFGRWETIELPFDVVRSTTYTDNSYYHSFNLRLAIDPTIARNFSFDNFRIYKIGD